MNWTIKPGSFTDKRDGKAYKTIEMPDGRTWMAENLNFATDSGSWCYDDKESNCDIYGRLYDWNTAMASCPVGWHLPTRNEWIALALSAGGYCNKLDSCVTGKRLKSTSGWEYCEMLMFCGENGRSGNGTDVYGFSALSSGLRLDDGPFNMIGYEGIWWAADGSNNGHYDRDYVSLWEVNWMLDILDETEYGWLDSGFSYSARCIQN